MKVFLSATSLNEVYGGPAHSVSRLAVSLVESGVEVGLWAADQTAPSTRLVPPRTAIRRLSGSAVEALKNFGTPNILHDNGIWRQHNHQLAVLARERGISRIVSTRGMVEPWARNHKRLKKYVAWLAYQKRDLQTADCHHATAESEAANLLALRLGVSVTTIPNGVDVPTCAARKQNTSSQPTTERRRTALFLGRLCPVKGLEMLIDAWARTRPRNWQLCIAGPDEAGYRSRLEDLVSTFSLGDVVGFIGPIYGQAKQDLLFGADLFVLPTYSESFGMAIAEALAHGLPVLTTTNAPWAALHDHDCGWSVAPTVAGIAQGLIQATGTDSRILRVMGDNGQRFVASELGWKHIAARVISLYRSLLGRA